MSISPIPYIVGFIAGGITSLCGVPFWGSLLCAFVTVNHVSIIFLQFVIDERRK